MDLYDSAPVGYFTVDRFGSILEANLTGAKLLGVERSTLVGGRFGHYVALADRDRFHFYCSQVGSPGGALETEIRLIPRESPAFYPRLEGARPRNAAGSGDRCMIAVSDISGSKRAEDALRQLHLLLETQVT